MSSWTASVHDVPADEAVAKLRASFAKYEDPSPEMQAEFDEALLEVEERLEDQGEKLVSISLHGKLGAYLSVVAFNEETNEFLVESPGPPKPDDYKLASSPRRSEARAFADQADIDAYVAERNGESDTWVAKP